MNSAQRKRISGQFALWETVLGGQTYYCAWASIVLLKSHSIRFLSVSKCAKCFEGNTFWVCRRGVNETKNLLNETKNLLKKVILDDLQHCFQQRKTLKQRCIGRDGSFYSFLIYEVWLKVLYDKFSIKQIFTN